MGYKLKNVCYETQAQFLEAFAQDCPITVSTPSTASGFYSFCSVNGTNIEVKAFNWSSNQEIIPAVDHIFTPQSSSCDYSASTNTFTNADIIELSWLVVGVWVAAWGFKKMIEVLKK